MCTALLAPERQLPPRTPAAAVFLTHLVAATATATERTVRTGRSSCVAVYAPALTPMIEKPADHHTRSGGAAR